MKGNTLLFFGRLLTVAGLGLFLGFGAIAGESSKAGDSPCVDGAINGDQAMEIAAAYMNELGYDGKMPDSTWHYSLRDTSCVNGQWRVNVDLGPHASIKKKRMVLVNCETGEVEDHFAEDSDLASR